MVQGGFLSDVSCRPTWFGPADQPMLGWIHQPVSGRIRGAVVICPPFGIELGATYGTLRVLADRLAAAGLLAMRFDYFGTGDSAGDHRAPDQVQSWLDGVAAAVEYCRVAGAPSVALVGLRVGALLAAHAVSRCQPISQLVLWDPCVSGNRYLREQARLYRLKVGVSESDTADVLTVGMVFAPQTEGALGALELADADLAAPHVSRVLLMPRPENADSDAVVAIAGRAMVETVEATEQVGLLDVASQDAVVPYDTLEQICSYLAGHATSPLTMVECKVCDEAMVGVTPDGQPIVERLLRVGPRQLFAVATSIEAPSGPTIVCVSQSTAHRVGPARLWPDMARSAAARGVCTVRYDRRSVGDSAVGHDAVLPAYSHEAVEDLTDVVRATCADQSTLALVGLCSGAWASVIAASSDLRPHSVYLINTGSWQLRPAPQPQAQGAAPTAPPAASSAGSRLRSRIKALTPYALALRGARKGRTELPEALLAPVVKRGSAVTLMLGSWDGATFTAMSGMRAVRRLQNRAAVRVVLDPAIEHSLITRAGRDLVAQRIVDEVAAIARP